MVMTSPSSSAGSCAASDRHLAAGASSRRPPDWRCPSLRPRLRAWSRRRAVHIVGDTVTFRDDRNGIRIPLGDPLALRTRSPSEQSAGAIRHAVTGPFAALRSISISSVFRAITTGRLSESMTRLRLLIDSVPSMLDSTTTVRHHAAPRRRCGRSASSAACPAHRSTGPQ